MSPMAWIVLASNLVGGAEAAREAEAAVLLQTAHREVLLTYDDRENAQAHWQASLALTEQAYELKRGGDSELQTLAELAERAFQAEEYAQATSYADLALARADELSGQLVFSIGNAVHHAHLVLGKLALRQGDVASAREHLLAAGRTPGSPQLATFGPNMRLAQLLLERGQKDVVLEYLALCGHFWRIGIEKGILDKWSATVQRGETPDFGANLIYGL